MDENKKNVNLKIVLFYIPLIFLSYSKSYSSRLKIGASYAAPYYTVDGKNVTGILANLMERVVSDAGYDISWKAAPTQRVYNDLINGKIDIYLGPLKANLDGFRESVIYSKISPITLELCCYYFGELPAITDKHDLSGRKVTMIRGYTYGGLINYITSPESNIEYVELESFDQAMKVLKNRNFDYHLDYKKTGDTYLKNNSEVDLKYSSIYSVDLHFIVSKKNPDVEEILSKVENYFLKIKDEN